MVQVSPACQAHLLAVVAVAGEVALHPADIHQAAVRVRLTLIKGAGPGERRLVLPNR